jgi:hypothetical protein
MYITESVESEYRNDILETTEVVSAQLMEIKADFRLVGGVPLDAYLLGDVKDHANGNRDVDILIFNKTEAQIADELTDSLPARASISALKPPSTKRFVPQLYSGITEINGALNLVFNDLFVPINRAVLDPIYLNINGTEITTVCPETLYWLYISRCGSNQNNKDVCCFFPF